MKEVNLWYLGHSSVCLQYDGKTLIFDYWQHTDQKKGFADGKLNQHIWEEQPLYIFSSHIHGDHFSRSLLNEGKNTNTKFILGDIPSGGQSNAYTMEPRQTLALDGLTIVAGASRDEGTCLAVQDGPLNFFHSGDNANWEGGDLSVSYFEEIDFIQGKIGSFQVIFIPVCDYDGYMYDSIIEGALYAVQKLNPQYIIPLHANGREYLYKDFQKHLDAIKTGAAYICPEKSGDSFVLKIDI